MASVHLRSAAAQTPERVFLADVCRSVHMLRRVGVPVLGIIGNMSYFVGDSDGETVPIFSSGGGQQLTTELQTLLLRQCITSRMQRSSFLLNWDMSGRRHR